MLGVWFLSISIGSYIAGLTTRFFAGNDAAVLTRAFGTFAAITNSDATFLSGASSTNGTLAQAFFRTTWLADFADLSNREGDYSLPIVFTLTAP